MSQSRGLFASPYAAQASDGTAASQAVGRELQKSRHVTSPHGATLEWDVCGGSGGPTVPVRLRFPISWEE